MKKIFTAFLALALVFLTGCGLLSPIDGPGSEMTPAPKNEPFSFTAEDINGKTVSFSDFSDKKLIMLNFFESWCGPCVNETPDLVGLYEKYKDDGFVIIGAFGSSETSEVKALAESLGVTYPVVPATESMQSYRTQYVPTTVFFDAEGNLLSDEPYVGSQSYSSWESIITSLLNR